MPTVVVRVMSISVYLLYFALRCFDSRVRLVVVGLGFTGEVSCCVGTSRVQRVLGMARRRSIVSFTNKLPTPRLFPVSRVDRVARVMLGRTKTGLFGVLLLENVPLCIGKLPGR